MIAKSGFKFKFNGELISNLTWRSGGLLLIIALFILLFLYLRGAWYRKVKYRIKDVPSLEDPHFSLALMSLSNSLMTQGYLTNFWYEIDAIYAARLEAIQQAQKSIHFETFFMTPGRRADEFAAAMMERSQAGVEVLIIADSLGVATISEDYWQKLKKAGVAVRFFHQFNWKAPLTYNIRNHRKMLLIDREIAFIGGMGVSDHWDGISKTGTTDPWLDLEVCFTGPIVPTLEGIFMQHWLYEGGVASLRSQLFKPAVSGGTTVLVTPSSSPSASSSVCALFYTTFLAAKQRIWLASPYFLADTNTRRALVAAKKRGVDVRILTVGKRNDKKLVYYAVREGYGDFLTAGIEIYEHQPSMMHAKVVLIDDCFVSTGSTNLDPRSLFHNEELNLSLTEPQLAKLVEHFFTYGISHSLLIDIQTWKKRPIWQQLLGQIALVFRWQL